MSYYINSEMKVAAYKSLNRSYGSSKDEVYYNIIVYRGRLPKDLNRERFEHIEFSIQITSDSPLSESLEKLGVNTEYPIEITGFMGNGDNIATEEKAEFNLDINQAEIRTKDRTFENQYFECPSCNYPTTPRVKVYLSVQDVDRFNAGENIEVASGSVSFKCGNRNCHCQGNSTYKDMILHRTLAGRSLQFVKKGDKKDEVEGDSKYSSFKVHMPAGGFFEIGDEDIPEEEARPENIADRLRRIEEELQAERRGERFERDAREEEPVEAPVDALMPERARRVFRRNNN